MEGNTADARMAYINVIKLSPNSGHAAEAHLHDGVIHHSAGELDKVPADRPSMPNACIHACHTTQDRCFAQTWRVTRRQPLICHVVFGCAEGFQRLLVDGNEIIRSMEGAHSPLTLQGSRLTCCRTWIVHRPSQHTSRVFA